VGEEVTSFSRVLIAEDKLIAYLLDPNHKKGGAKADFFINICGFSPGNPQALEDELRRHPLTAAPGKPRKTKRGVNYLFICDIQTPKRGPTCIVSVWNIDRGGGVPRLSTAYPSG